MLQIKNVFVLFPTLQALYIIVYDFFNNYVIDPALDRFFFVQENVMGQGYFHGTNGYLFNGGAVMDFANA